MKSRNNCTLGVHMHLTYTYMHTLSLFLFLSLSFSFSAHTSSDIFSHTVVFIYLSFSSQLSLPLPLLCLFYTMPLRPLSSLSHSFPIITLPLYSFLPSLFFFRAVLSLHLPASVFSFLPGGSVSTTGIRGQALNISHLVMPRGGHHPGFVVLTH